MMNLNPVDYTSRLSWILSEDVCAPELRNPKLSGMSKRRNGLLRLFQGKTGK